MSTFFSARLQDALIGMVIAAALIAPGQARAAVLDADQTGASLQETAVIAAPPQKVWSALISPSKWWSPAHTYSQNAANLTLEARAGGCWCEVLPDGGSVEHMHVVNVRPGSLLRMTGGLGPSQSFSDGILTVTLKPQGEGTALTLDYVTFGHGGAGFAGFAKAGDAVLGEQVARLKRFVESGTPETPK